MRKRAGRMNRKRNSSGSSSMDLAPDFDEFIGSLIANEVEFVVVRAYALVFHGTPRYTGDIDIPRSEQKRSGGLRDLREGACPRG